MRTRVIASVIVAVALVAVSSAGAWPGKPKSVPPRPPAGKGPPPAWIETQARSLWLAYGSYCWTTTCVTTIPPDQRDDIPALRVRRGSTMRVHLGFDVSRVTVRVDSVAVKTRRSDRVISWSATHSGLVQVIAVAGGGVTFLARVRWS